MNPHRTAQANEASLQRYLTQKTLESLSKQNVAFILNHQHDSLADLAAYLREQRMALGHIPARTEVLGGDYLELRFRGWARALSASGVDPAVAAKRTHCPSVTHTSLFAAEYAAQRELHRQRKNRK